MEDYTLVESSVAATINAPIENVNIPRVVLHVSGIGISSVLARPLFGRHDDGGGWPSNVH